MSSVVGYYLDNRAEVDAYVRRQQQLADEARYEYQAAYPDDPVRRKLLARRGRTTYTGAKMMRLLVDTDYQLPHPRLHLCQPKRKRLPVPQVMHPIPANPAAATSC